MFSWFCEPVYQIRIKPKEKVLGTSDLKPIGNTDNHLDSRLVFEVEGIEY